MARSPDPRQRTEGFRKAEASLRLEGMDRKYQGAGYFRGYHLRTGTGRNSGSLPEACERPLTRTGN